MEMQTFQYVDTHGWNIPQFPDLDSDHTLVLIFASPSFKDNPEPLKALSTKYKKSKILGCSTAGEIFSSKIFDKSLSVAVIRFDNTPIKTAKAKISNSKDSFAAGVSIMESLQQDDLHSIFVLSDGLNVNGSELINGLNAKKNSNVIITGGLAGDGSHFKKTWLICGDKILDNHVIGVGLYGKHIHVGYGSRGGWDIFGPERRITRASENILYELDHRPALSLYKEYLGERAIDLPSSGLLYPLAIRNPTDKDSKSVVRTILNVDEEHQALIFAGDMPVGYYAQLMHANFDRLIDSAHEAGTIANQHLADQGKQQMAPVLAIDVSCVGRRLLLGDRTEEETEATFERLAPGSHQIGFYSYGELSPLGLGDCRLHNQTMTITSIYEADA